MGRVGRGGMGGMGDEGVGVRMGGLVHAYVPVRLTGNVAVGHGERACGGDEEGRGKAVKRRRVVIYI